MSTGRTKKKQPIYVANTTTAATDVYEHHEDVS